MNITLPKNKLLLVSIFALVLVFGFVYLFFVRIQFSNPINSKIQSTNNDSAIESAPYFVPPKSEFIESTVTGRVVKLSDSEITTLKASHKIVLDGKILTLAVADDDKLKQQEGSTVTIVGDLPINQKLSENSVLKVKYILFK